MRKLLPSYWQVLPGLPGLACLLGWLCAGWGLWMAQTPVPRATTITRPRQLGIPCCLSPDGRFFVTVQRVQSEDTMVLWDTRTGDKFREMKSRIIWTPTVSPDGRSISAQYQEVKVTVWSIATGKKWAAVNHGRGAQLTFSPNGKILV